jgi:hypothetical protein
MGDLLALAEGFDDIQNEGPADPKHLEEFQK